MFTSRAYWPRRLEKNPAWGYAQPLVAPQHDVYTWKAGRKVPYNAQIKTHANGSPAVYANDIIRDYRANLFLITQARANDV